MESVVRVKKSLKKPIRKLTSCVLGVQEKRLCSGPRTSRDRGGGNQRRPKKQSAHPKNTGVVRSYQDDLEKERKLREATNAQKNAERAAMRAHFRRKYELSQDPADSFHLRSIGGRVALPQELSTIIYPESGSKDEGFDLLRAFQGLSFGSDVFSGTPSPGLTTADACKVM